MENMFLWHPNVVKTVLLNTYVSLIHLTFVHILAGPQKNTKQTNKQTNPTNQISVIIKKEKVKCVV